jgi:glycosyltransferase involved in cell wall biosynthesis
MINKINFLINWDKKKSKSWSGTHYSLLNSLKKQYAIKEIEIKLNLIDYLLLYLYKVAYFIVGKFDFRMRMLDRLEKKANLLLHHNDNPTIMFEEYDTNNLNNSYLYIDLSTYYLYDIYLTKSDLLQYTPLKKNVLKNDLKIRLNKTLFFIENCKGIFTMSSWLAIYLKEKFPLNSHKVHFVGGGSNIDPSKIMNVRKNGKRFIFIGVDWKRKNGQLVVDAFNKLSKVYPDSELYIIGPKKLPNLKNKQIFYLGNLSFQDISHYLNLCDFFVMPSKFEAYGLVFAEALIYGLPCIGKNLYAMPEFIENGKNGILIQNDDIRELFLAMKELFEYSYKYKNYVSMNHSKYLQLYSWDNVATKILQVIKLDHNN